MNITTHTIVKNEDKFISYALKAWEPYVKDMLVVDDGSTDKTVEKIKALTSAKIKLEKTKFNTPMDLTNARNGLLEKTQTVWFLILDGDEVWDSKTIIMFLEFLANQPKKIWAVGMRTKNAIGDVYHYMNDSTGRYEILGRKGHLNIRAYRKLPGFKWLGDYPVEYYADRAGHSVNDQNDHLSFFEGHYFHFTNLNRSSLPRGSMGRKPVLWETGVADYELPEVMRGGHFEKRSKTYDLLARLLKPAKYVKKHLVK